MLAQVTYHFFDLWVETLLSALLAFQIGGVKIQTKPKKTTRARRCHFCGKPIPRPAKLILFHLQLLSAEIDGWIQNNTGWAKYDRSQSNVSCFYTIYYRFQTRYSTRSCETSDDSRNIQLWVLLIWLGNPWAAVNTLPWRPCSAPWLPLSVLWLSTTICQSCSTDLSKVQSR